MFGPSATLQSIDNNVVVTQPAQQAGNVINIYAGTNENAELSNFANRPFKANYSTLIGDENYEFSGDFKSVEQAFQYAKSMFLSNFKDTDSNNNILEKIKNTTSPSKAKSLGRTLTTLNSKKWDNESQYIMKDLINQSFEQNPDALEKLLDTGNATLTHTQDKTKYRELFPKILMEVREELGGFEQEQMMIEEEMRARESQPTQQTSEVESLEMEGAAQLQLDLQFELEADLTDVNVALEVYWEGQIEPFPEKKAKLREQKLYPFSKMIKAFNEGTYIPTDEMTSEEVFMDKMNNCIL
jgi:ribA/ribD-fused uncharacterized protein